MKNEIPKKIEKKPKGNSWEILNINKFTTYRTYDLTGIDHLIWSLQLDDHLEYRDGDRVIEFKVIDPPRLLENYDLISLENYKKERKSEILSDINNEGYKLINVYIARIDREIIEEILKTGKYKVELVNTKSIIANNLKITKV